MKNIKLNWKKKYLSDKSGYWYSAKVAIINWEYVVEPCNELYSCYLFTGPHVDEINICPKMKFKTVEIGQKKCEEHLAKTYEGFKKFIENKTYETTR
jgi:hypothetical protein